MKRLGCAGYVAIVLTATTAVFGLFVQSLAWEPQSSIDIIGILWLLSNVPILAAWTLLFFLFALTIWSWWLAYSESSIESDYSPMPAFDPVLHPQSKETESADNLPQPPPS